jgi:1-acyl-sn-glycerol-3-phosphate acyltransferase
LKVSLIRRAWVTFSTSVIGFYGFTLNRLRTIGEENIPRHGGVLIASNHISAGDTVFLPAAVIRQCPLQMLWAPAKEELFTGPRVLRWLFTSWGAFPVKRGRDVRAARLISDLLKSDKVMLFPEGTRHKDGILGRGNRGVGKIIYDTRPQVVPTALIGLNRWKFPGFGQEAVIVFGPPLDFSDLFQLPDLKETHQLIVDRVMDAIAGLLNSEGAHVNKG